MTISIKDIEYIYIQFRRAQSFSKCRGFRPIKNFEKYFNEKMKEFNKKHLVEITKFFITKWSHINPYIYFQCGFELLKTFSYKNFFNPKIMLLYIQKDKNKKREINITKKGLIDSAIFVKKWMKNNNKTFNQYIHHKEDNLKTAIDHYLKNKIDASFIVFLIRHGMILTDDDRSLIPYIQEKYRKINFGLNDINDFTKKLEEKLYEHRT